jgi:uncharacterized membrane protein YciS (DUF1049 family)
MRIIFYVIGFLVIVFGLSFSMMNSDIVTLQYYIGSIDIPLSILLALTFGMGLILGILVMSYYWLKLKKENLSLNLNSSVNLRPVKWLIPLKKRNQNKN